jgi:hypothetical protein
MLVYVSDKLINFGLAEEYIREAIGRDIRHRTFMAAPPEKVFYTLISARVTICVISESAIS